MLKTTVSCSTSGVFSLSRCQPSTVAPRTHDAIIARASEASLTYRPRSGRPRPGIRASYLFPTIQDVPRAHNAPLTHPKISAEPSCNSAPPLPLFASICLTHFLEQSVREARGHRWSWLAWPGTKPRSETRRPSSSHQPRRHKHLLTLGIAGWLRIAYAGTTETLCRPRS